MKVQRLRFRYRLTAEALELRHRDIVSAWESAARGAGLAVSHSAGKRPAPQISLAAPLPQGATSESEIVDIFLEQRVDPADALARIARELPPGLEAFAANEVGVSAPSVQAALRWAEYEVDVPAGARSEDDVRCAIDRLLSSASLPAEYRRETKVREYDLRPLVLDVRLLRREGDSFRLAMKLRAEQDNTARADQVVLALGLPEPVRVHRKHLALEEVPAAIVAFRRAGEDE
ncbi:MAG TPA: TIGR03936 family radical SAM-associated protein [Dehalococcoidia bacterium]|jgi:radical SAM-linked protein|nr:TIGR03936 family radical SAM-associated protein [Dehalococcoidia bacterium]